MLQSTAKALLCKAGENWNFRWWRKHANIITCVSTWLQWNSISIQALINAACGRIDVVAKTTASHLYTTTHNSRTWLSRAFVRLANTLLKDGKNARDNRVLACNFAKYSPMLIFFTRKLINKPFSSWLIKILPHLKYVATLPCNLSLMACFADINVSPGIVATYARCGGIVDIRLTANLPRNLPVIF